MKRILVIRGGAIGDFILTLPTLVALRRAFPTSAIEILGRPPIAALAHRRFYADAISSLEDARLAPFFSANAELPSEVCEHLASFDLIISYVSDADGVFRQNLKRAGAQRLIEGPAKISQDSHAAVQLAKPLAELGLTLSSPAARLFPSSADLEFAAQFLAAIDQPFIALHPGSGSASKNWPVSNWIELAQSVRMHLLVVGGEADRTQTDVLRKALPADRAIFAEDLPLPQLAAVLQHSTLFVGHDSGISHLAAATGAPCLLLFGPTDPRVWAPANKNAHVLRAPAGDLNALSVAEVARAAQELMRIGIST